MTGQKHFCRVEHNNKWVAQRAAVCGNKISAVMISAAGAKNIKLLLPPLTCRKI